MTYPKYLSEKIVSTIKLCYNFISFIFMYAKILLFSQFFNTIGLTYSSIQNKSRGNLNQGFLIQMLQIQYIQTTLECMEQLTNKEYNTLLSLYNKSGFYCLSNRVSYENTHTHYNRILFTTKSSFTISYLILDLATAKKVS